jgi:ribosomal protein S18 acetylase RimI-like enzyme
MNVLPVILKSEMETVAGLAREIWTEHYPPLIGPEQVEHMLGQMQSGPAIARQISDGTEYFLVVEKANPQGYAAIQNGKSGELFLSKLYVRKSFRGSGAGLALLAHVLGLAEQRGMRSIRLTVNRANLTSIDWYLRRGFSIVGSQCQEIGRGFVMDDHVLVLPVENAKSRSRS